MILTYLIVAFNVIGSITVVLLTWGCARGVKAERAQKLLAQQQFNAQK